MQNKNSLGKDAVSLTVSKIITMILSMAVSMMLARFRTLEEYGTYSQMLLVINLVSTLLMLGLPNSINYFLSRAENDEQRKRFLSVYYTLNTILGFIIGLVLVLSVPLIESYFNNPIIHSFIYFLALMPWASITANSVENILIIYSKTKYIIVYQTLSVLIQLCAIVVIQLLGLGFRHYLISAVAINCLLAVSVHIIVARLSGGIRFLLDKKLIRSILFFSVPIGLAGMVGTLNTEIDKLLIGYLMDTKQLAIYTNSAKELPLTIIATSITAVLMPRLTVMLKKGKTDEAISLWGSATQLAFIVIAFIAAGIFTYADDVMTLLYSSKYLPGVNVFRVYTLNLVLRCTYFGIILNAVGKTKMILVCSIASLILNAALNPLFYFVFGTIGPAVSTFICILLIQILQLKFSSRELDIKFSRIFPWKKLLCTALINIAFGFVFYFIKRFIPLDKAVGSIAESIILGIVWGVCYILITKANILKNWHRLNESEN